MFDNLLEKVKQVALNKTRFYTVNYKTYHRDRTCSYLTKYATGLTPKEFRKEYGFMQWEPVKVGDSILHEFNVKYQKRNMEAPNWFELTACRRCGK